MSDSADHTLTTDWRADQPLYDGVPRRHYTEPQLHRWEHYEGQLAKAAEADVRELLTELTHYFQLDGSGMPLPPTGLPGVLHEKYDRYEPAADLLWLGFDYFCAAATGKGRAMHNRWKAAREIIRDAEKRGRDALLSEILERERAERDAQEQRKTAKPQLVYFIAGESGPIKIGMAADPAQRCRDLQTSHHERLAVLATCKGGGQQERAYHELFAAHRLNGEWFDRHPDILVEIERLSK